ncbi:M20 family metallopeptidase [Agromyces badenianii]|uniref:M20 family metallopeptidase n=1 Tax=Agromyces badenianii TaxID=2080742 RepID=UPI000D592110|nr:M20/M25/M40 family metallo-hydrolase [Agromyces badenianii]PWC05587.1 acetylornithine deacetylase [Agromyces badenianii]
MQDDRYHDLDGEITASAEGLADFLANSIRIPSVTGTERAVADWYAAWMQQRGWETEHQLLSESPLAQTEDIVADRANVIGYPFGRPATGDRVVVVNGHLDVVPVGDETAWTHAPFAGTRIGDRVHGRGTVDTKGGIAAALHALDALRRIGTPLSVVPVVHLVIGEETTGVGTRLALTTAPAPAAAIVLEPTGGGLVTACSGLQFFAVEAFGRAAHSSAPWRGVDALARLLRLRDAMVATANARSAAFQHPRFADVPTGIPFNIGTFTAGSYRAAVPDAAVMTGRIGLLPGEDPAAARRVFAAALAAAVRDDPYEREYPHELIWSGEPYPGWETGDEDPLVAAFVAAIDTVDGDAALHGFTAGNDAGQYAAAGASTVVFGPGDAALAHTTEESVSEADLLRATRILGRAIAGLS